MKENKIIEKEYNNVKITIDESNGKIISATTSKDCPSYNIFNNIVSTKEFYNIESKDEELNDLKNIFNDIYIRFFQQIFKKYFVI